MFINQILKYPILYRLYQKSVRKSYSEYDLLKYIFLKIQKNNIKMLDICCGDSFILDHVNSFITNYMGLDYSEKYIQYSRSKWHNYSFLKVDLRKNISIDEIKEFQPNFIFMNGAIHHLDDQIIKNILSILNNLSFKYFLSVDPVKDKNAFLNRLMIKYDRGKFIRSKEDYQKLLKPFDQFVIDDFYKMSFKSVFHSKNLDIPKFYQDWKKNLNLR